MPERDHLEERVARLEETLFFQERLLRDLSDALTAQQRQLDNVEHELTQTRARLEDLQHALDNGGGVDTGPPPHYEPRE